MTIFIQLTDNAGIRDTEKVMTPYLQQKSELI